MGAEPDSTRVGRFEIRGELGSGGMGVVYDAVDTADGQRVALKTVRQLAPSSLYRLKREFRALQGVHHPNLVSIGELFQEGSTWFFTMEYVDGEELPAALKSRNADATTLRELFAGVVEGLAALHEHGVVHRDVKPSNVMVTAEGRVVLLDFGLVTAVQADDQSTDLVGTAAYMAPEQAASRHVSEATDWYSLGVMLFEALTGELPYNGTQMGILLAKQTDEAPDPRELAPDCDPHLAQLCSKLLRFDPQRRPDLGAIRAVLGVASVSSQWQLRPPSSHITSGDPFVGREHERAIVTRAFEQVQRQAEPHILRVIGASGLGKSALLEQALQDVRRERPDLLVFRGRCYEREQLAYKGLDGVVDALSRYLRTLTDEEVRALLPPDAELLVRVFPSLARVKTLSPTARIRHRGVNALELRARVSSALRELLRRLAERSPLVLVIDDVQWSDQDTLQMMTEVLSPPHPPALLVCTTQREEATFDLARPGLAVHELAIGPLVREEAIELTRRLLSSHECSDVDASAIADEANGHPLHIAELVRHAATRGPDSERPRLDEAIRMRVEALEPGSRTLLRLACLASAPLPQAALAEAADMPVEQAAREVGLLKLLHLLDTQQRDAITLVSPFHDRVRAAVEAGLDEAARAQLHRTIAHALTQSQVALPNRSELLFRHFELAGQHDLAFEHALRAADTAAQSLAFDREAELCAEALRLGSFDASLRIETQVQLGNALIHAGRGKQAADVLLQVAEQLEPARGLNLRIAATEQLLTSGHIEVGLTALKRLMHDVDAQSGDNSSKLLGLSSTGVVSSLLWWRMRLAVRGLGWNAKLPSEIAESELARLDTWQAVAKGLLLVDSLRGMLFQTRSLHRALQVGEPERVCDTLAREALVNASNGSRGLRRARRLLQNAAHVVEDHPSDFLSFLLQTVEGIVAYFDGQYDTAAEMLEGARTRALELPGVTMESNSISLFLLLAHRYRGDLRRTCKLYDETVRDADRRGDKFAGTTLRRVGYMTWLVRDDLPALDHSLEEAVWVAPGSRYHLQHWYDLDARGHRALYGTSAEEIERALRDTELALDSLLMRVQSVRTAARWLRARLLLVSDAQRHRSAIHKLGKQLKKESWSLGPMAGTMVHAELAARLDDRGRAAQQYDQAAALGKERSLRALSALAERRAAVLRDDQAAVARTDDWLQEHGVRNCPALMKTFCGSST